MDRKQTQSQLQYELGLLLRPLLDALENPTISQRDEARIRKQFAVDSTEFRKHANEFCKDGDVDFSIQRSAIHNASATLQKLCNQNPLSNLNRQVVEEHRKRIQSAIASVPVDVSSHVHEPGTPFSTYCRLKALIEGTASLFFYADRYVSSDLLLRYVYGVPQSVVVTIVTWPRSAHNSSGKAAYDEFISVSRTLAKERGFTHYKLITSQGFHDRWLRLDDVLFQLGGSLKDAAWSSPFTVSQLDTTQENIRTLDGLVSSGTEVFGINQTVHP